MYTLKISQGITKPGVPTASRSSSKKPIPDTNNRPNQSIDDNNDNNEAKERRKIVAEFNLHIQDIEGYIVEMINGIIGQIP